MAKYLFLAVLLNGFSGAAAADDAPAPPDIYAAGPSSMMIAATYLSVPEKAGYAMLEAAMQQAEARIVATNCTTSAGIFEVTLFSDGSVNNPSYNFITVNSPGSSFTLNATLSAEIPFWGQSMTIKQSGAGALKGWPIAGYAASVVYNGFETLMNMTSTTSVMGVNGRYQAFSSRLTKNFYRGVDQVTGMPYIFEWGLQTFSMLGYPVQKYWNRAKALRDDSVPARTLIVKDRLVGPTPCRIVVDTSNYNNMDFFYQIGTLTISTSRPAPPYDFNF